MRFVSRVSIPTYSLFIQKSINDFFNYEKKLILAVLKESYHFPIIIGIYSRRGRAAARPSYPAAQQRRPTHCTDCL
jgi:hypothetical protein